jgi:steroid delta-isomerase-like uncharacterized protein
VAQLIPKMAVSHNRAVNERDSPQLRALYHEDAVNIDPTRVMRGIDQIMLSFEQMWSAFGELEFEIGPVAVGDESGFANEWTGRGQHTGAYVMPDGQQLPATGRRIEIQGGTFFELRDGKISRQRDYFDVLGWMQQLGLAS